MTIVHLEIVAVPLLVEVTRVNLNLASKRVHRDEKAISPSWKENGSGKRRKHVECD